ncbi:aminoglycoside phosphotransferase family protein [Gallaecimonas mangrovi]|uniref:aminoglycoside phosphotransferase family protein n=1 Tax=Gallaecimonas mangrovi TaxID=2291597 RepID=UPI000E1FFC30|nr:phosphotransferase [Gallaecimonas mangrovi]
MAATMRDIPFDALQSWACSQLGLQSAVLEPLTGDAGTRRYWRLAQPQGSTIVVAYPEGEASQASHFAFLAHALAQQGIRVPEPLAIRDTWMLLPDLGDQPLSTVSHELRLAWYGKAVNLIAKIQQLNLPLPEAGLPFVKRKRDLFQDWYLSRHLGVSLELGQLDGIFSYLFDNFFVQPKVPAHRDYHARNLHRVGDELAVIDFQDLQLLPLTYDAVSLIRDSYVDLSEAEENTLITQAFSRQAFTKDPEQFRRWFDLTGILRQIKILGIFCRLHYQDGKSGYLNDLAPTRQKLLRVARRYPALDALVGLLEETP